MRGLWQRWLAIARRIGNFQARLLLTALYFTVAAPFGAGVRLFSDPLRTKPGWQAGGWQPRTPSKGSVQELQQQF